jgi:ribose transport system substrate-binding protein
MISRRLAAAGAALAVVSALLAGCGSSSGSSTSATSGAASISAGDLQAKAQAKVAELLKGPKSWPGPTQAFRPGAGKAAVMACGFAATICAENAGYAVQAIKAMGWSSGPPVDGQLSPQVQSGFIDRAVQDKLDAILIVSVDILTLKAAIDRAVAAHLPIACIMCSSIGPEYTGKVINVTVDFTDQGTQGAWKLLADSGGNAKVVTSVDDAYLSTQERAKGLTDTIKANCPNCKIDTFKFPTADIAKPGPPEWTGYLASHPKGTITNYVGHYDGMGMAVAKTNVQVGRTEIKVGSYDGSPENVTALVSQKPPYQFVVAEPYTFATWSGVDLMARVARGAPLWPGYDKLPNQLITKENAQTFLNGMPAPSIFPAPPGDWQGAIEKLWTKA